MPHGAVESSWPREARRASKCWKKVGIGCGAPISEGHACVREAGGQPSGLSFDDNVRKECEEEASLPPEIINELQPTGAVNYRYTTRKGLSTATIVTYDLELPPGLLPLCADGEVEEFTLMPLDEVLRSLREDLPLWRPNAALVAIDFLVKRGIIDRHNEPAYEAIAAGLRAPRIRSS